jgi:hypothetical protein
MLGARDNPCENKYRLPWNGKTDALEHDEQGNDKRVRRFQRNAPSNPFADPSTMICSYNDGMAVMRYP